MEKQQKTAKKLKKPKKSAARSARRHGDRGRSGRPHTQRWPHKNPSRNPTWTAQNSPRPHGDTVVGGSAQTRLSLSLNLSQRLMC